MRYGASPTGGIRRPSTTRPFRFSDSFERSHADHDHRETRLRARLGHAIRRAAGDDVVAARRGGLRQAEHVRHSVASRGRHGRSRPIVVSVAGLPRSDSLAPPAHRRRRGFFMEGAYSSSRTDQVDPEDVDRSFWKAAIRSRVSGSGRSTHRRGRQVRVGGRHATPIARPAGPRPTRREAAPGYLTSECRGTTNMGAYGRGPRAAGKRSADPARGAAARSHCLTRAGDRGATVSRRGWESRRPGTKEGARPCDTHYNPRDT